MAILIWIVVGFVAGAVARAIMPGKQPMGMVLTMLLGLVGSLVGGLAGTVLWGRNAGHFTPGGLVLSILGALLVLFVFGRLTRPARA